MTQDHLSWLLLSAMYTAFIIRMFNWDGGKVDAETKEFDARARR